MKKPTKHKTIRIDLSDLEKRARKLHEIDQDEAKEVPFELKKGLHDKFRKRLGGLIVDVVSNRQNLLCDFEANAFCNPCMGHFDGHAGAIYCESVVDPDCAVYYIFDWDGSVTRGYSLLDPIEHLLGPVEKFGSWNGGLRDLLDWIERRSVVEKREAERRLAVLKRIKFGGWATP